MQKTHFLWQKCGFFRYFYKNAIFVLRVSRNGKKTTFCNTVFTQESAIVRHLFGWRRIVQNSQNRPHQILNIYTILEPFVLKNALFAKKALQKKLTHDIICVSTFLGDEICRNSNKFGTILPQSILSFRYGFVRADSSSSSAT